MQQLSCSLVPVLRTVTGCRACICRCVPGTDICAASAYLCFSAFLSVRPAMAGVARSERVAGGTGSIDVITSLVLPPPGREA